MKYIYKILFIFSFCGIGFILGYCSRDLFPKEISSPSDSEIALLPSKNSNSPSIPVPNFNSRAPKPSPLVTDKDGIRAEVQKALTQPTLNLQLRSLGKLLNRIDAKEFSVVYSILQNLSNGSKKESYFNVLYDVWADQDAVEALRFAQNLYPESLRNSMTQVSLSRWATSHPKDALSWVMKRPPSQEKESELNLVLGSWAEVDPRAAIASINSLPPNFNENQVFMSIANAWVQTDPKAAFAWVETLPSNVRLSTWQGMISQWANVDSHSAFLYVDSLKNTPRFREAIPNVIPYLSEADLSLALNWIQHLPVGRDRTSLISSVIPRWASFDLTAASKYVRTMPDGAAQTEAIGSIIFEWQNKDLQSGFNWAQTFSSKASRDLACETLISGWAEKDSVAAAQFLKSANHEIQLQTVSDVATQYGLKNANEALNWAQGLSSDIKKIAISAIFSNWSRNDPSSATQYIQSMLKGEDQQNAIEIFAEEVGSSNPQGVLNAINILQEDKSKNAAYVSLMSSWSSTDPRGAIQWLNELPEGETRQNLMSIGVQAWCEYDLNAVSNWLQTLTPGKSKDVAISTYATWESDPQTALRWAQNIGDPEMRTRNIVSIVSTWWQQDKTNADNWISHSNLTKEQIQEIKSPVF
jgi:hypothetical protein